MNKYRIEYTAGNTFPYNVQELTSVDNGKTWYYSGNGKFFETLKQAEKYISRAGGVK